MQFRKCNHVVGPRVRAGLKGERKILDWSQRNADDGFQCRAVAGGGEWEWIKERLNGRTGLVADQLGRGQA